MQLNKSCDSEKSFSYFLLFCWDRLFTEISTAGFTYAGRKHQLVAANLQIASLNERAGGGKKFKVQFGYQDVN